MQQQLKNRWNTVLWASMIILILTVYWFAEEQTIGSSILLAFILSAMLVKFIGIGFQFMELKHAHSAWQLLFSIFIVLMASLIWFIV